METDKQYNIYKTYRQAILKQYEAAATFSNLKRLQQQKNHVLAKLFISSNKTLVYKFFN